MICDTGRLKGCSLHPIVCHVGGLAQRGKPTEPAQGNRRQFIARKVYNPDLQDTSIDMSRRYLENLGCSRRHWTQNIWEAES